MAINRTLTLTAQRAAFTAGVLIGLVVGVPAGPAIVTASADPGQTTITEDSPGWDCRTMGNRICGPASDETGHAPGCYDDSAALVAAWPCSVVVDQNGNAYVYTPDAR